jgi:hypothetical protein
MWTYQSSSSVRSPWRQHGSAWLIRFAPSEFEVSLGTYFFWVFVRGVARRSRPLS